MSDSLPEAGIPGAPVAASGVELLRTVGEAVHLNGSLARAMPWKLCWWLC